MECYELDIDLGDELDITVSLEDELDIDVLLEDMQIVYTDCPTILSIFGGYSDSDDLLSSDPFAAVNGLLNGGVSFS